MKTLALLASLAFVALNAFGSGKTPPRSDGYGSPQCRAYDAGSTEEHSPHPSCESCLSSGHTDCDMKCYSYDYSCTAVSHQTVVEQVVDPVTKQVHSETRVIELTYSANARTESEARDRALQQCYWSQGYSSCSVSNCSENSHESSSFRCSR